MHIESLVDSGRDSRVNSLNALDIFHRADAYTTWIVKLIRLIINKHTPIDNLRFAWVAICVFVTDNGEIETVLKLIELVVIVIASLITASFKIPSINFRHEIKKLDC